MPHERKMAFQRTKRGTGMGLDTIREGATQFMSSLPAIPALREKRNLRRERRGLPPLSMPGEAIGGAAGDTATGSGAEEAGTVEAGGASPTSLVTALPTTAADKPKVVTTTLKGVLGG